MIIHLNTQKIKTLTVYVTIHYMSKYCNIFSLREEKKGLVKTSFILFLNLGIALSFYPQQRKVTSLRNLMKIIIWKNSCMDKSVGIVRKKILFYKKT